MELKLNIKPVIKSKTKRKSLGGIPSSKYIEDMPNEIWKSLEEFPNYMFSNYGRIKNISLNILMSESRDSDEYLKANNRLITNETLKNYTNINS